MTLALSYQVHRSNLRMTWVKNQVTSEEIRIIRLRIVERQEQRTSLSTAQIDLNTLSYMLNRALAVLIVSPASKLPPTHGHGKLLECVCVCTSINLLIGEVLDPFCFY